MLEACGPWLPYILGALAVGLATAWWLWGNRDNTAAPDHHGHDAAPPPAEPLSATAEPTRASVAAKAAPASEPSNLAMGAVGTLAAAAAGTVAVAAAKPKAAPKAKAAPVKKAAVKAPAKPVAVKMAPAATPAAKKAPVKAVVAKVTPAAKPVTKPAAKPAALPAAKPTTLPAALKATPKKVAAPTPKAATAKPLAVKAAPLKTAPAKAPAAKTAPKAAAKPKPTAKAPIKAAAKPAAAAKPKLVIPDNLELLKGVGPKLNGLLKSAGVTSFAQVAAWKAADIREIDTKLGSFAGRIDRDNWVDQAKLLLKGDVKGFEKKYGTLGSEIKRG